MSIYLDTALEIARKAGEIIKTHFSLNMNTDWKPDGTPVTAADLAINSLVIMRINSVFPDHSILGEEESASTESQYVWVCDPIDGTIPFSSGVPICAFSLALVKDGESILGVAFDPFMSRLVWAEKGKGAFLNGEKIDVNQNSTLPNSVISVDTANSAYKNLSHFRQQLLDENVLILGLNSSVYCCILVAVGQFSAHIYSFTHPWDGAAVKCIVEEAGGKVTDLHGDDNQDWSGKIKGYIASNGLVHDQLVDLINQ